MKAIFLVLTAACSLICARVEASPASTERIIPRPESIVQKEGRLDMRSIDFFIDGAVDARSREAIRSFAKRLDAVTGAPHRCKSKPGAVALRFEADTLMGAEQYSICIDAKGGRIAAGGFNGFLYAIQSLTQMLPEAVYGGKKAKADWSLPFVEILDKPRFAYRGMHLDVSRHFFDVAEVKRYLDIMAVYKLNTLHWHLTDDQGWRIEIKAWPELTRTGAYRAGTMIGKDKNSDDGIRYGGFYTQEQIKEVVEYASTLGIVIIPEIDLPGHMVAALASYPQLGCTGGPYEVRRTWGIAADVLCAGNEQSYAFLESVLSEVAQLFPGEYIHIGGDECPKKRWKACSRCQEKIRELGFEADGKYSAEQLLQGYLTARIAKFLASKGKKVIGWDEILESDLGSGVAVMSWRGTSGGREALLRGLDCIMTPNSYMYFDYCQGPDKAKEPLCIGGHLEIDKVYSYEPLEGMPADTGGKILGVQANLWTEYIGSVEYLEYMLLPRMVALSEVQWCSPANKDYSRFKAAVPYHMAVYDLLGYTYSRNIFGQSGLTIKK
ncbi:MAG: beta-N-acetylhexosaminidase [Bacteroidales bacterium]|nr:beta-N-acetylhexosaminidase [Bacteroidales bacterium]